MLKGPPKVATYCKPTRNLPHRLPSRLFSVGGLVVITHGQVVLQIATHLLLRLQHRDAVLLQQAARPDAGELQQLRALDGAGAQHHGTPRPGRMRHAAALVGHTHRLAAFEQHSAGHGGGPQLDLAAFQGRAQECVCGRPAHAMARVDAITAYALGLCAVEVVTERQPGLVGGGEEVPLHRVQLFTHVTDKQGATCSGCTIGIDWPLKALVHRAHILPAPTRVAGAGPVVEVTWQAAAVHHGIDRA